MKQKTVGALTYKNYAITAIRSKRRSVGLEITPRGEIKLRLPLGMSDGEALHFVEVKEKWLEEHLAQMNKMNENALPSLTDEEIYALAEEAARDIPERLKKFAPLVGVTFGRVTIRLQKTRWGSCSQAGNLNFNCLLMLCPDEVRDYVVVHELCHRLEMNHSARFWQQVGLVLPEYKKSERWLKEHGGEIMRRCRFR